MTKVFDTKTISKEFDDITNRYYKQGHEHAVNKACEWLDCYIDNYLFIDAENKAGIKWNDFINAFRKAMKSGCLEFPNNCEKGE